MTSSFFDLPYSQPRKDGETDQEYWDNTLAEAQRHYLVHQWVLHSKEEDMPACARDWLKQRENWISIMTQKQIDALEASRPTMDAFYARCGSQADLSVKLSSLASAYLDRIISNNKNATLHREDLYKALQSNHVASGDADAYHARWKARIVDETYQRSCLYSSVVEQINRRHAKEMQDVKEMIHEYTLEREIETNNMDVVIDEKLRIMVEKRTRIQDELVAQRLKRSISNIGTNPPFMSNTDEASAGRIELTPEQVNIIRFKVIPKFEAFAQKNKKVVLNGEERGLAREIYNTYTSDPDGWKHHFGPNRLNAAMTLYNIAKPEEYIAQIAYQGDITGWNCMEVCQEMEKKHQRVMGAEKMRMKAMAAAEVQAREEEEAKKGKENTQESRPSADGAAPGPPPLPDRPPPSSSSSPDAHDGGKSDKDDSTQP